jgi:hypothetical protein
VLALAFDLDSVGPDRMGGRASLFSQEEHGVCEAILTNGRNNAAQRAHAARIDDPRLRPAFMLPSALDQQIATERGRARSDRHAHQGRPEKRICPPPLAEAIFKGFPDRSRSRKPTT